MPPKRRAEGRRLRLELLRHAGFAEVGRHLDRRPRGSAAPDDVLDAAACALTARDILTGHGTCLPAEPPRDARGLRMEIWY